MIYAIIKNQRCIGVNNLPLDPANLAKDETQVEVACSEAGMVDLLGKTYVDGQFVETPKTAQELREAANQVQKRYLQSTDWQVIRHRDQVALGVVPSLTDAEYQALLAERQKARAAVIEAK